MVNYPDTLPREYKPLSAWAYFGYSLLFSIPVVGFILLIVFSFDSANINRRNYARSYFCGFLVATIIAVIMILILTALGMSFTRITNFNY